MSVLIVSPLREEGSEEDGERNARYHEMAMRWAMTAGYMAQSLPLQYLETGLLNLEIKEEEVVYRQMVQHHVSLCDQVILMLDLGMSQHMAEVYMEANQQKQEILFALIMQGSEFLLFTEFDLVLRAMTLPNFTAYLASGSVS